MLDCIARILPEKYIFLLKQVNSDFILDSVPNEFLGNGWKRTILNQNLYEEYKNIEINYALTGIQIYDLIGGQFKKVELDLFEGILIGYKVEHGQYDFDKIEITDLRESEFSSNKQDLKYQQLLKGKKSKQLDLHNGFEIEFSEKKYFVIKDLEDGNYLSIDDHGKVYGMFHDPFLVELLDENIEKFIEKINSNRFSIEDYKRKKID
jgi:hypothetical protein